MSLVARLFQHVVERRYARRVSVVNVGTEFQQLSSVSGMKGLTVRILIEAISVHYEPDA